MRRIAKSGAALLAISALAGCTVFPNAEPPRVMDLAVKQPVVEVLKRSSVSIRVSTPQASEPFTGSRILGKPTPYEYRVYGKVRWRTTMPVLVRDLMTDSLRSSNAFHTVLSDASSAEADKTLTSELTAFHTERKEGGLQALIELHAQVVDNQSKAILCSASFQATEQSISEDVDRVTQAFSVAGQSLATDITLWAVNCQQEATSGTGQPTQP
ncbi:ABC-type transport auxiliary lipoprotein family protein [Marinobacter nitratireducens]|uniref:ABC-type transport auxiliary lipoprotein family protein n=1 Tax=Marinobacter nitratireducens TaxID=1137280 RepID=UPI0009DD42FC|nr:ABC-type transport auxiliary lipoprotein family protein [Marinobacter nitratireducens]